MENAAIDHISLLMALTPAGSRCLRGDKGGGNCSAGAHSC